MGVQLAPELGHSRYDRSLARPPKWLIFRANFLPKTLNVATGFGMMTADESDSVR